MLGGGIIGCEFASIFAHFGSEVTIVEMLPTLIPQEDEDAAKELKKAFKKRGIAMHLEKQCTGVDDLGDRLVVHFGDGESVEADLMLVAVGRAPSVKGLGLDEIGIPTDPRSGVATDDHMRTAIPTIFAAGDVAGRWQLAHTAFREGEIAAENAMGHEAALGTPSVPRPIYTDPEVAGVGLTEAQARERYGDAVAVGVFPWVANARAVMSGTTAGWVKSIHETNYGELLGLVIVGPHATDLIEVGVVAMDAESTVETVARRNRTASDALRSDQGSRPRRPRPGHPPTPEEALVVSPGYPGAVRSRKPSRARTQGAHGNHPGTRRTSRTNPLLCRTGATEDDALRCVSSPAQRPGYPGRPLDVRLRELTSKRPRDVDRLVVPAPADPEARHRRRRRLRRRRRALVRAAPAEASPASLARS